MRNITIKQAQESDIPIVENILLDTINWLNEKGQPLWGADEVKWDSLSKNYQFSNFYIAYSDGIPSGCMALIDYDPFFWPDVKKGESLFVHKLSAIKTARKTGVADALMDFYKEQGKIRGVKSLRLDTHALRPKLRAFYERHGFVFVEVKVFNGDRHTAFYVYHLNDREENTIKIETIDDADEKTATTRKIMHALPAWFSPPEDIEKKAKTSRKGWFFV